MTAYTIPKIEWAIRNVEGLKGSFKSLMATNTFVEYVIQYDQQMFYCYYGNGRFKEFKSLANAKAWVENTHYPAQVAKYLQAI